MGGYAKKSGSKVLGWCGASVATCSGGLGWSMRGISGPVGPVAVGRFGSSRGTSAVAGTFHRHRPGSVIVDECHDDRPVFSTGEVKKLLRGMSKKTPSPLLRTSITIRRAGDEIYQITAFLKFTLSPTAVPR